MLHTRERVHDLGVFKAVGMTPRQTVAMVLCSVAGTGLLAGVLAVPAGIAVHRYVIPAMAGAAGLGVPASLQNVYGAGELAALALAGLAIALAGALLPAGWASHGVAEHLRAERLPCRGHVVVDADPDVHGHRDRARVAACPRGTRIDVRSADRNTLRRGPVEQRPVGGLTGEPQHLGSERGQVYRGRRQALQPERGGLRPPGGPDPYPPWW